MEIHTNNPLVRNTKCKVIYYKRNCIEFYKIIRDQVHLGAKLLSDPMPASRRMMESPFRSAVLLKPKNINEGVDLPSLETIEKALRYYERMRVMKTPVDKVLMEDFQYVDEQLLQSTLKELGVL